MQNKNEKLEWRRMKSDADLKKYGQNDALDLIVRTIEGLIAIKEVVNVFRSFVDETSLLLFHVFLF